MHLVGTQEGLAVLVGAEWDMTGADTMAYPVWRIPFDDHPHDPCGIMVQGTTHIPFDPVFDTITIVTAFLPVSSWELPLTIAPLQMTSTDPCSPVGIQERAQKPLALWPVPVQRDGELFVGNIADDQAFMILGVDGRIVTASSRGLGRVRMVDLKDLAPGVYTLRTTNGIARSFVIAE
jgi:hypothetical protein